MKNLSYVKKNMIERFNLSISLIEKKEILRYIENIEILIDFEYSEESIKFENI